MKNRPRWILPAIVVAQFMGTSLWFAGNAVLGEIPLDSGSGAGAIGYMTSSVQLGFIFGTLLFAFLAISDRISPRLLFFACSILGGLANLGVYFFAGNLAPILLSRFLTGAFLAGIYPVGMKLAASWYQTGLGKAIGFLVGALVLGTAFPHLLKGLGQTLPWQTVIFSVSGVAAFGGLVVLLLVPDGPHLPNGAPFRPDTIATIFRSRKFRASAFGYFGHMWELYTFWAFVPFILGAYNAFHPGAGLNVSLWSFWIIALGSLGCAVGGLISLRSGSAVVASAQLSASGICCLASPLFFFLPTPLFLGFLLFWGIVVVGDSPQFSALNAQTAPKEYVGTALTIVNSIGFGITVVSIQFTGFLAGIIQPEFLLLPLTAGPLIGLYQLRPLLGKRNQVAELPVE